MASIEFWLRAVAQPKGSMKAFVNRRTGRAIITSDNPRVKGWEYELAKKAGEAMDERGGALLKGPLELEVWVWFIRPKGAKKRKGHTVRPDLGKLVRAVEDALEGVVYDNDSEITAKRTRKLYSEGGGSIAFVRVTEHMETDLWPGYPWPGQP